MKTTDMKMTVTLEIPEIEKLVKEAISNVLGRELSKIKNVRFILKNKYTGVGPHEELYKEFDKIEVDVLGE
jgi:hypothetical protein